MSKNAVHNTKILFALPSFHVGGIEKHLLKQFAHFDQEKYTFHLVTFFHNEGRPDLYDSIPSSVHVHRMYFTTGIDIRNTWKLFLLLREIRPDIVVSSMVFPNTLMRALKPFVGYKVIAREHNTYADKTLRHKLRDHICAYFSDAIVAVSRTVAEYASRQAWIPRRKFSIIHNGVDIDAIQAYKDTHPDVARTICTEFNLPPRTRILLNVARIKPQKNHTLLIEAFAQFVAKHPDHVLFILGAGADEEKMHAKVRELGLTRSIFIPGYREDVYAFYMASTCFVLTSDIEGFPNVAIEAMAFGLPVLSTRVAGIDEILEEGKNGYFLDRNPEQVCATMEKFVTLHRKEKENMTSTCLNTVKKYTMLANVQKYEALFLTLSNHHVSSNS
jgi:glycosyltransferase involved in cell wall biosynthesis